MKRSTKKGFTIVELVIVIAIIAILAAVLIPTFASLIQKANTSADIQAVREMNTFLATNEVTGGKDITDVYAALAEGGMTAKDYHPLVSGRYFFWDKTLNRVLYTDDQYKVIYPEEYKDVNKEKNGWLSLSGEIRKEKIDATEGTYIVTKAEQLYYLVSEGKATNANIKLDTAKLDLMGANISFSFDNIEKYKFEGAANGTTITGLSQLSSKFTSTEQEHNGKQYACGLIQMVGKTSTSENPVNNTGLTLTVKNITIADSVFGDLEVGGVAAVIGRVENNAVVNLNNVHVKNTVINGMNKVGTFVGQNQSGTVKVTGCTIENVTVNCSEGEAGKVIGAMNQESTAIFDKAFGEDWVKNVTLNLVKGAYERKTVALADGSKITFKKGEAADEVTVNAATVVYRIPGSDGKSKGYRLFYKNAYVTMIMDSSEKTLTFGADNNTNTMTFGASNTGYAAYSATVGDQTYAGDKDHPFIGSISVDK